MPSSPQPLQGLWLMEIVYIVPLPSAGCLRVILSFKGRGTEDIFDGEDSKAARKTLPAILHEKGAKTLDRLNSAVSLVCGVAGLPLASWATAREAEG